MREIQCTHRIIVSNMCGILLGFVVGSSECQIKNSQVSQKGGKEGRKRSMMLNAVLGRYLVVIYWMNRAGESLPEETRLDAMVLVQS